jgi:misacylated tRNA(Ala) deacylase
MVIIDGIDRTPCCGTHLPTLSTLPLLLTVPVLIPKFLISHVLPTLLPHSALAQPPRQRTSTSHTDRGCHIVRGTRDSRARHARRRESKRREKHVDDLECEQAGSLGHQLAEEMAQSWSAAGGQGRMGQMPQ